MKISLRQWILGAAALVGFTASANAAFIPATWSDQIGGTHYVSAGGSYSYTHDLTDNGFRPLHDVITHVSLAIDLYDDNKYDSFEIAQIDITGIPHGFVSSFDFGNDAFTSGWSLIGLIELNVLGRLSVTIRSVCNILVCGDFNVGTSTLAARGYSQVPEPGTLALLGLGLLGVGLGRRKLARVAK